MMALRTNFYGLFGTSREGICKMIAPHTPTHNVAYTIYLMSFDGEGPSIETRYRDGAGYEGGRGTGAQGGNWRRHSECSRGGGGERIEPTQTALTPVV